MEKIHFRTSPGYLREISGRSPGDLREISGISLGDLWEISCSMSPEISLSTGRPYLG